MRYINAFDKSLRITDSSYHRYQYQSFMTAVEWRNVEMSGEFAVHLREGNSMFQFPYFRQMWDLWKVLFQSYKAATKYNSRKDIITSDYMMMSLFVALFTTLEYIPKGVLSILMMPFLKKENNTDFQKASADYFATYAERLETIPFYDHDYTKDWDELSKKFNEQTTKTWVDWMTWKYVSFELRARRFVSAPFSSWFNQEGNVTPGTTDVLVKYRSDVAKENAEAAKSAAMNEFVDHLKSAQSLSHVKADVVNEHLYARNPKTKRNLETKVAETYTNVYARLRVPRYADFQPTLRALGAGGIRLRKIAGQERVQVKCEINATSSDEVNSAIAALSKAAGTTAPIYTYTDRLHPNRRFCLFDVPVRDLHEQLKRFDTCNEKGASVRFIHNF